MTENTFPTSPVVVGGVGGSGTRVVAKILMDLGYHMGLDLNQAYDNLWITFLFKHLHVVELDHESFLKRYQIFIKSTFGKHQINPSEHGLIQSIALNSSLFSKEWYMARANSIINNEKYIPLDSKWGWKEPNSHMLLGKFDKIISDLKYIHVVRHGLDMAFSTNQNQLKLWGQSLIGTNEVNPRNSLRFWCTVHERIVKYAKLNNKRFMMVNFDRLCLEPLTVLKQIAAFIEISLDTKTLHDFSKQIQKPISMGRYRSHGLQQFLISDLAFVEELGFSI